MEHNSLNYKSQIALCIYKAVFKINSSSAITENFIKDSLEVPKEQKLGDYAFPCFLLSKSLSLSPNLIAQKLKEIIDVEILSDNILSEIKVVGPYLNFFLNQGIFARNLIKEIISGEYTKQRVKPNKQNVIIEYSQPNTHKAFHVGHTRAAALGDSIARLVEWNGDDVIRANYMGDEGTHVARCLWYFKTRCKDAVPEFNRGEFLGTQYVKAVNEFDISLYSKVGVVGVTTAKVLDIQKHPSNEKLKIVNLETINKNLQVVCGGEGFNVNDLVPYATPGVKINGRSVNIIEKDNVVSEGMICSEAELLLTTDKNKIPVLEVNTKIGEDVANLYAFDKNKTDAVSDIKDKEKEVSYYLSELESEKENEIKTLWRETKEWCMQEFYENYKFLGCKFDYFLFESEFGESSKKLVREFLDKGIFVQSRGTIGADLSESGLGFCILIKSDGNATYASRDLSLAIKKFQEFKVDQSIYVVDSGQEYHFKQVFKCLEKMGSVDINNCKHVPFAIVVLKNGKMSSRKGNVILFSTLKSSLINKIRTEYLNKYENDWKQEEIVTTAEKIAVSTIRYGMLNQDNNTQVIFDLNEWTSRTGNTGPYILYAYARITSILREFDLSNSASIDINSIDFSLLKEESETHLLQHLNTYQDVLCRAGQNSTPNVVCTFVYELARKFHKMYHDCNVLNVQNEELKAVRVTFVKAIKEVLSHGFNMLGMESVERM